jgi:hypothetical protein
MLKELLAKHVIVLNPATLQLGYWLKKVPSAFGQKWIFLNLGNIPLWVTVVEFLI